MPGDERPLQPQLSRPGEPAAQRGDERVPPAVERGDLALVGLMPNSSNSTFLVQAGEGDDASLAIYKPVRGESPLWDFAEGTLAMREVAAFEVASALGWPDVPATLLRDGPYGPGSVQRFVPHEPHDHYFTLEDRFPDAFRAFAAFDLIANNADRKAGHCLLGDDGRIWGIDHGLCFHVEPKLRTVIWRFIGEPIPGPLVDDLFRLGRTLAEGSPPSDRLGSLLSDEEMAALRRRIDAVLADPVFPAPTGDRPYPWPPV